MTPRPDDLLPWVPIEHPCGCVIEWAVRVPSPQPGVPPAAVAAMVEASLGEFLPAVVDHPCPWCGSTTGQPSTADKSQPVYLVQSNAWYRLADESVRLSGRRNAAEARRPLSP